MTKAQTLTTVDNLDMFTTTATTVTAANMREGMVLMDPELGTPLMWLDSRQRATRNTGNTKWLAHNLETGRLETLQIGRRTQVRVLAA